MLNRIRQFAKLKKIEQVQKKIGRIIICLPASNYPPENGYLTALSYNSTFQLIV